MENGKLKVGSCTYDKVLLSGVETMKESTWKLLKEFVAQGGKLIVAGKNAGDDSCGTGCTDDGADGARREDPLHQRSGDRELCFGGASLPAGKSWPAGYIQSYRKEDMITFYSPEYG